MNIRLAGCHRNFRICPGEPTIPIESENVDTTKHLNGVRTSAERPRRTRDRLKEICRLHDKKLYRRAWPRQPFMGAGEGSAKKFPYSMAMRRGGMN